MSVALDTIEELRNPGNHKVAKTDIKWNLNTSTRSNQWVQWNVRKIKGVRTYYEVYNPDPKQEILWVEFHVKARTFQILESVSGLEKLLERSKDSMYGVKVDVRDMNVDAAVREVQLRLDDVYNLVEQRLKKRGVTIMPLSNGNGEPWYVGWSCDDKCLDKSYDKEFRELKKSAGLTWLPWVGKEYRNEKILVIGESNYADKDWTRTVDKDLMYTRKVVDHICFRGMHRKSQTLPNIARMLNVFAGTKDDIVPMVWSKIAFADVCQRCLKRHERPTSADVVNGWRAIFALIRMLQPRFLIFMGKTAADFLSEEVQGMQVRCPITCSRKNDSRHKHAIIRTGNMQIPMILLPHPSNGFSHNVWRKYLRETFPSDPYFRRLVD